MKLDWRHFAAAILIHGLGSQPALAQARCEKQSPAHTVALVELYTSEGCDSCPPAERWLNGLPQSAGEGVVALALHVDYWDRLGWPDRFASPRHTERQQLLSKNGGAAFIYTPGVFLNLREFRRWRSPQDFRAALKQRNARPAGADIRLELDVLSSRQLAVTADFKSKANRPPKAFIALYESGLVTEVKAGENRGATLRHDFVVREWLGPIDVPGAARFMRTIALRGDWNASKLGVTAFVQDSSGGDVLQALSMPVCTKG